MAAAISMRRDQAVGPGDALAGDVAAPCRGRARCGRTAGRASRSPPSSKSQRLDRDQRLVVVHAQAPHRSPPGGARGTWCRPAAGRARRCPPRAAASTAGRDDPPLLVAHRAALAGMRVEAGDRQPRTRDAEVAAQRLGVTIRAVATISSAVSRSRHLGQRDVDRHRDDPQLRRGQHHHGAAAAGEFGQVFGVAGEAEAGGVERRPCGSGW